MMDGVEASELFRQAAELNREDPLLSGSLLEFPDYGQVVMTGDLHGHRRNFDKLQRFCDLEHAGARHVILHEIIHEELGVLEGRDMSHLVLLDAVRWKCLYPEQVHFLLGNHELAQLFQQEITKNGRVVTVAFEQSVAETYQPNADRVMQAMIEFMRSLPLAGRTANRVFLSHSLPGPQGLNHFDPAVLSRVPSRADLTDHGSAHQIVWGRYHTKETLDTLAKLFDVDFFICGHQPQETGYDVRHDRMVILASDHNHGVFLTLDLNKPASIDGMTKHIRPFAAVA